MKARVIGQDGGRPQRLIGFDEPRRALRRQRGTWFVAAGLAVVVGVGFAGIAVELSALRGEMRRLAAASAAARDTAERALAVAREGVRSAEKLARSGSSGTALPVTPAAAPAERAFIAVDRIAAWREGGRWRTAAIARNDGATPTRDLQYYTSADFAAPKPTAGLLLDGAAPGYGAAIAGHAELELAGPLLGRADAGRTLYVHGRIAYKDVLSDDPHVTQYCFWTHLPRDFGGRRPAPQFRPCVHLNCADRGCTAGGAG